MIEEEEGKHMRFDQKFEIKMKIKKKWRVNLKIKLQEAKQQSPKFSELRSNKMKI